MTGPRSLSLGPPGVAALLLGAALIAWIVTIDRMSGMDAGPGTDLGALGWYVGVWVTMMAAMMLPSAAPMVLFFARAAEARAGGRAGARAATAAFVAGYLLVWTAVGLVAYGVFRVLRGLELAFLEWEAAGPLVAGAAIAAAGVYQLSPLKRVCLRHCRSPLHVVTRRWRAGPLGALRMGAEHGGYCVGCCIGLMVILFALGVMSVLWMAAVAAVVFAEKVLPVGPIVRTALAAVLVGLGIWVAASPGTVPGLHEPATGGEMEMMGPG